MPDLERCLRDLELHLAHTEAQRQRIKKHHAELDTRRWMIAFGVLLLSVAILIVGLIAAQR